MLATLCSNPAATNALIGKTIAKTLSTTVRPLVPQPHGETDQGVRQDRRKNDLAERQARLGGGRRDG